MTVLRVSLGVVAVSAVMVACGGGGGGGGRDSGPGPVDAQMLDAPTTPTDAQPGTDTGMTTRMCGVAGGACDVIAQDCAGATDGCYYARTMMGADPTTLCAPAGTAGDGEACTTVDDCLPGFTCDSGNVCRHYCCMGMSTDCALGQICVGISGAGEIGVCNAIDNCTLAPQGGCDAGEGCWVIADDGSTTCFTAGTKTEGQACGPLNDCVAGFGCFGIGGAAPACIGFCRLGMDSDCSGGHTCQEVGGGLPTGIGLCLTAP